MCIYASRLLCIAAHHISFPSNTAFAAASAWLPLLYDTIVLVLTVRRTYALVRYPNVARTMRLLLKEGVFYYRCVLVVSDVGHDSFDTA